MGTQHLDKDLIAKVRTEFEAGYNLFDLAIKYNLIYETLKNISSQEGWEKNSRKEAIRIAELELESEKCAKVRNTVKNNYKSMTKQLRTAIIKENKDGLPVDKDKEEAVLKKAQSISVLYSIDKDLHNIMNSKEETDILTKKLKNQKLKDDLLPAKKSLHIK